MNFVSLLKVFAWSASILAVTLLWPNINILSTGFSGVLKNNVTYLDIDYNSDDFFHPYVSLINAGHRDRQVHDYSYKSGIPAYVYDDKFIDHDSMTLSINGLVSLSLIEDYHNFDRAVELMYPAIAASLLSLDPTNEKSFYIGMGEGFSIHSGNTIFDDIVVSEASRSTRDVSEFYVDRYMSGDTDWTNDITITDGATKLLSHESDSFASIIQTDIYWGNFETGRFFTTEYLEIVNDRLKDGGVFLAPFVFDLHNPDVLASIDEALHYSFDNCAYLPVSTEYWIVACFSHDPDDFYFSDFNQLDGVLNSDFSNGWPRDELTSETVVSIAEIRDNPKFSNNEKGAPNRFWNPSTNQSDGFLWDVSRSDTNKKLGIEYTVETIYETNNPDWCNDWVKAFTGDDFDAFFGDTFVSQTIYMCDQIYGFDSWDDSIYLQFLEDHDVNLDAILGDEQ